MKKKSLLAIVFFACLACSSYAPSNEIKDAVGITIESKGAKGSIAQNLNDTSKAKAWLIEVIESYFNNKNLKVAYADMRSSLTNAYYNYKQDAISLDYDGGDSTMTQEKFKKKWAGQYNTKFVGYGGFFISTNDHGKVRVTICNFIRQNDLNSYLFKVVIEDTDFKNNFNRDIKVVKSGNSFLVDDVIEY